MLPVLGQTGRQCDKPLLQQTGRFGDKPLFHMPMDVGTRQHASQDSRNTGTLST
jgi:hypothetical protein